MSNIELNEKKIQILKVAEKLFSDNGFEGTSIRNIAKEANINIAMVSYYFGSKERLLEALIIYRTSDLKLQLENLLKENLEPADKVDKFIEEIYTIRLNCNGGLFRIMHFELSSKKSENFLNYFSELRKDNLNLLEIIIKEGQQKGVFRKDIVVPLLISTIIGTFFHFQTNKIFFEKILDLNTEALYNDYIKTHLTKHIQQTIKALLVYEN